MTDLDANAARERFRHSPVGIWESYLGGGHDMHTWIRLIFLDDGTGRMEERWGVDCEHVTDPNFKWKPVGDRQIEITHEGETRLVNYDFRTTENEYRIKELRMFEVGRTPDEYGDVGFWISPYSLVHRDEPPADKKVPGYFRRLWTKQEFRGRTSQMQ